MTLQVIRDWVLRFNARGADGLMNGKAPGQPSRVTGASIGLPCYDGAANQGTRHSAYDRKELLKFVGRCTGNVDYVVILHRKPTCEEIAVHSFQV